MKKAKMALKRVRSPVPGGDATPAGKKPKHKVKPAAAKGPVATTRPAAGDKATPPAAPLPSVPPSPVDEAAATASARTKKVRPGPPLGRLERLEAAIAEVRVGARASLRTRKLLASGTPKMAQKVIEEAAEVAIEAVRGDTVAFLNETVDLFYNTLVLASELGVSLARVWEEMDRRERTLGMAEKLPKTVVDY